jgi:biopolymer transport protein TolR
MTRIRPPEEEGGGSLLSDINVTPLVDVVLVLLIIFMVSAPMMKVGMDVRLPAADRAPELGGDRLVVSIDKEGKIYLDEREIMPENFERVLHNALVLRSPAVYLQADREISYGFVAGVLDKMRRSGAVDVGLVTVPGTREKAE